jgi:hypothetical protein
VNSVDVRERVKSEPYLHTVIARLSYAGPRFRRR